MKNLEDGYPGLRWIRTMTTENGGFVAEAVCQEPLSPNDVTATRAQGCRIALSDGRDPPEAQIQLEFQQTLDSIRDRALLLNLSVSEEFKKERSAICLAIASRVGIDLRLGLNPGVLTEAFVNFLTESQLRHGSELEAIQRCGSLGELAHAAGMMKSANEEQDRTRVEEDQTRTAQTALTAEGAAAAEAAEAATTRARPAARSAPEAMQEDHVPPDGAVEKFGGTLGWRSTPTFGGGRTGALGGRGRGRFGGSGRGRQDVIPDGAAETD